MQSKFSLQRCELDLQWDEFVANSPHGTPFVLSTFINSLDINYPAYYCCKGNEKIAALLLIVDDCESHVIGHHDVIHDGIIHRSTSHLNMSQTHSEEFSAQQHIGEFLAQKYDSVTLKLHPQMQDIRALLWVNYHNPGPKYQVTPRYTSELDLTEFQKPLNKLEDSVNYINSSVSRRQEIRYGLKKLVTVEKSENFELCAHYYALTMARQGIEVTKHALSKLAEFLRQLAEANMLVMYQAQDHEGNIGSFSTYLLLNHTAYYFYGANNPQMREQHTGTAVLWQTFPHLAQLGVKKLDLEGINSPQRGWFKLSFGGSIQPYYHVKLVA